VFTFVSVRGCGGHLDCGIADAETEVSGRKKAISLQGFTAQLEL
jgi:hypothetical protein